MAKLSKGSIQRIGNVVRYWETRPRNEIGRATAPRLNDWAKLAITTSGVSAGGTTPGTGTAKLQTFDGTSLVDAGYEDVNVYNIWDKTVASGSLVQIKIIDGYFMIENVHSCSNLT